MAALTCGLPAPLPLRLMRMCFMPSPPYVVALYVLGIQPFSPGRRFSVRRTVCLLRSRFFRAFFKPLAIARPSVKASPVVSL